MAEKTFSIKKGRKLPIHGEPKVLIAEAARPSQVAVLPSEFPHVKPKLEVAEGDQVKIGSKIFFDKGMPDVHVLSPGAGTVSKIVRGERRALQQVIIDLDDKEEAVSFNQYPLNAIQGLNRGGVVQQLLGGGLWPYFRQRPFNGIADPKVTPRSIFINAMNTEPLAANRMLLMQDEQDHFRAGVEAIKKLTQGSIYVSVSSQDSGKMDAIKGVDGVRIFEFSGLHPAGNTSVHIYHIERLRKNEIVWTINAHEVALIGRLFLEGRYPIERTIALAGSGANDPQHYKTRLGASFESIIQGSIPPKNMRFISGSVLTGTKTNANGFVAFYKPDITVIPEGKKREFIGWMLPGFNYLSFSRAFLSALSPNKEQTVNTNENGSLRAIVATDIYDRYLPLDILAVPLIKSIIGEDTEKAENLGLLECVPEDFALASFMCPSKVDVCGIIQNGLDMIKKEMA